MSTCRTQVAAKVENTVNHFGVVTQLMPSCHCHDNSYASSPILIKTKIPRFYLIGFHRK